ncbi:MAG: family 43 glycosylhydrolase, partial [Clostridia bacterium]|nr:family 43 glycosylhydrolase [Clostridia bacterium]
MYRIYWKPEEEKGAAADFIPYFDAGKFHLFYLYDHRNPKKYGEGIRWYKVETSDFVHFESKGEMIPAGSRSDEDLCAFTGGIIKHKDVYHIFYTGHNVYIKDRAHQNECVMHAVSEDLTHWKKLKEHTFYAPDGYDAGDFRDPHVYYDEERGLFTMLLCARPSAGERLRKGETIAMVSDDLCLWKFDRIVYAPAAYHTHECPDMFRMGDWWYLIFSEYSDDYVTRYRMSKSPNGPWIKPADDAFDGRAFYAAKTASDGENRYLFGWNPTRLENSDYKPWMWGGNLITHKIIQHADGTLGVQIPDSVRSIFG